MADLLTDSQKASMQALYKAVINPLIAKYRAGTQFNGVDFITDEKGKITDVLAHISFSLPADPDGEQHRIRKKVSIWLNATEQQ